MAQRIPDSILERAAFIYPTIEEANKGVAVGGSAFFVGVPWEAVPGAFHTYAITNRHVIEPPAGGRSSLILRLKLRAGGTDTLVTNVDEWLFPTSGDDIAVRLCQIDGRKYAVGSEPVGLLITDEILQEYDLGIGDEVFSVGRFLDAESDAEIRPVLRFGRVAASPPVSVAWWNSKRQPSYLVEMRSRTGFSGSPIYIFIDPSAAGAWVSREATIHRTTNLSLPSPKLCGPWILGVHWGQLPTVGPAESGHGSGIAAVVPGQVLRKMLLEDEELKRARKSIEDEWNARPHATLETATSLEPASDNPAHKEDFMRLLSAASKAKTPDA